MLRNLRYFKGNINVGIILVPIVSNAIVEVDSREPFVNKFSVHFIGFIDSSGGYRGGDFHHGSGTRTYFSVEFHPQVGKQCALDGVVDQLQQFFGLYEVGITQLTLTQADNGALVRLVLLPALDEVILSLVYVPHVELRYSSSEIQILC